MITLMIFVVVGFLLFSSRAGMRYAAVVALVLFVGMNTVRFVDWEIYDTQNSVTTTLIGESSVGSVPLSLSSVSVHEDKISTALSTARSGAVQQLDNGDMLVLPLSQDFVAGLLGPDGAEAVAKLNASISPELRQAYALIPLSATAPQTASPVIRHASGIRTFLSALSHVWTATAPEPHLTAEANTEPGSSRDLTQPSEPPEWIDNPGIGQTVVQSQFVEAKIPAEDALRPAIIEALKHRVTGLVSRRFAADDGWEKVVELAVTDDAIHNSFRRTWARTEVIDAVGNPTRMRKTYALIEFPEEFEEQILGDIETGLKKNRVSALCITLGIVWVCAVLLNLAFRAGQHGTILRKLTTVPVMGLLILPCVLAFFVMTNAMANGRTFDFSWSDDRISCVIDRVSK
ncbi:MAG: hypothetical protein GY758_27250 [Fuerstiella sp.]|nr:hypothetical protein [Fuerstiella sp.]MCP4784476.1 hypothetical protein [Fuerstiella sp.]MCP4857435.1 hypothetical protein [Fuerstiella sp.]